MESPVEEIDAVIYKLTTGSPRLQQQTLEYYFAPNASFQHPFCTVNGNRNQILSIFRWYKVLSPEIKISVNGVSYEEARQRLYVDISQTFRIWPLIPLGYRANVNLVTVLQLTRDPSGRDPAAERAIVKTQDSTPSYGSNAVSATDTSPFTTDGVEKPATTLPNKSETVHYYINSQNDLYQVSEFVKFASIFGLNLPNMMVNLWHLLATWLCVLGALVFTPFTQAMQSHSDSQVEHRSKVRSHASYGPSFGGDATADKMRSLKQHDLWELEAKYLGVNGVNGDDGKMEGLKMKMSSMMKTESGRRGKQDSSEPVLEWMKMEKSQ